MSFQKNKWSEPEIGLFKSLLENGYHLRKVILNRSYVVYDQCPDTIGVTLENEVATGETIDELRNALKAANILPG